jgi:two-component system cell cycle response regulator DivK
LLVDDHQDSLAMYALGLLAMGFQAITAENAEDGFARACELHPDVVVADVTLPGISGLDLTRRLRSDTRTRDAGIIVLTGHALGSAKQQATDAGCDRFLLKPCLPDALAHEIRNVLVRRRHAVPSVAKAHAPRWPGNDGDTKLCPQCRGTLVFTSQHPILTVGVRLERTGSEAADRVRYERAWVCRNVGCDYRELVEGALEG